jgi:hypothetical protein
LCDVDNSWTSLSLRAIFKRIGQLAVTATDLTPPRTSRAGERESVLAIHDFAHRNPPFSAYLCAPDPAKASHPIVLLLRAI